MKASFFYLSLFLTINSFSQDNVELKSVLSFADEMNDIWGYSDSLGNEYALCGLQTGVAIVDVTDPSNPAQIQFIPGDTSIWRDIKTWDKFAYVTNESGNGLQIIDLRFLPDSISYKNWSGGLLKLKTAHNLFIDTSGIAHLFGSNIFGSGIVFLDLKNSPKNPTYIGSYSEHYVHDGMVKGDTVYTAEIFKGEFAVIDVSDKTAPVVLARQRTPGEFTHNTWISNNGNHLFTTDEIAGASVASFDISEISNIQKLDEYRSNPGDSVIPHNVHYKDDHLIISYYRDGVKIIDAFQKDNLIEVGSYDTSPLNSGPGFDGCWGVYPYLPSGIILASDISEGLYVLEANYLRACYLRGTITDTSNGVNLAGAKVEIIGTEVRENTSISGQYAVGISDSGSYDIRFSKSGCKTLIKQGVELKNALTVTLDVDMDCDLNTSVNDFSEQNMAAVYPTLFQNVLFVEMPDDLILKSPVLQIFYFNGQNILTKKIKSSFSSISGLKLLPNGIYIVQVEIEGNKQYFKAIKH